MEAHQIYQAPKQYASLANIAYELIKKAIFKGNLEPGKIYKEIVVAKEIGMSKTPVHDALTKLADRGFIEILPRRGFQVTDLTDQPISDIFEFRRPLEQTVIYKIVPVINVKQLEHMNALVENLNQSNESMDYQEADRSIHKYLAELTNNQYLIKSLDMIWELCNWIGLRILQRDNRLEIWKDHHLALHHWILRRNPEKAWKVLKHHIDHTENRYIDGIK